jgi:hypothetical protein
MQIELITPILSQFKRDIQSGFSVELSLSRAWKHAQPTGQFIDKKHLALIISMLQKMNKKYSVDFFN